ncbi:MAG: pilus assembly protein PilM [Candidatus Omnitrophica bacterium]|nr:pilus assembly protein PilM [Candidatus Omnitrophota bacterium]
MTWWPQFALSVPKLGRRIRQSSAALVIRPDSVELVWEEGSKSLGRAQAPITEETPGALTGALQQLLAASQLKAPVVAVSLASTDILTRFFMLPFIPKAERDTAVQFEARKYVPFKMDGLAWDYRVVSSARSSGAGAEAQEPLEIVLTAVPLEVLGRLRAALSAAGIQPTIIEPVSQSLARLTKGVNAQSPKAFHCIVELHGDQAHLVITRSGLPHLTRDLQGIAAPGDGTLQRLVSELSVSMDFFKREYPSASFSTVWLVGDEETVARYQQGLSAALPSPVQSMRSLLAEGKQGAPLSSAAASLLQREPGGQAGWCLNLLAREASGPAVSVERTPQPLPTIAELKELVKHPVAVRSAIVTAVGCSMALWIMGSLEVSKAQHRLEAAQQARPTDRFGLSLMTADVLQSTQQQADRQLQLLKRLMDQRPRVAEKLDALARSLPDGVWLTGVTFEDRFDAASPAAGGKMNLGRQAKLVVSGACFLGASGQELQAIQEFEARVKSSPQLQRGLGQVRVGKVDAASDNAQNPRAHPYKTFQLDCQSSGRL